MEAALTKTLPKCLKESLTCYIFVESQVVDSLPDIVTCNSNGYIYEVKNKKVLRSLDINGAKGCSISYYHLYEIDKFVIFYLVLALKNKLFLVRRTDEDLQVGISERMKQVKITNLYNDVKDIDVSDFKNAGYPQIKISYFNSSEKEIIDFPVERLDETETQSSGSTDQKEDTWNSKPISDILMEKLQSVKLHLDELEEEKYRMEQLCSIKSPVSNNTCDVFVAAGTVKFALDFQKPSEPEILVIATWHKMFGGECILGMRIRNCSKMTAPGMELLICNEHVSKYAYNLFPLLSEINEESLTCPRASPDIQPGDEIFVVGAFPIPAFMSEPNLSVTYYLTPDSGDHLHKGTLELDALEMTTPETVQFEDQFTIEDLMAVMTSKTETRLKVETGGGGNDSVEWILVESLGFKKIKHLKDKFFYCTSTILKEVFVFLKQVSINPTKWKMYLYTSDDSQIYLLVNALYDLLPENTTILCEEE